MANNILLKKSSVAAKVPTTGDLDYGELALNYADGALYYKTSGNTIARLNPLEADTLATVTGRGATTSTAITVGGLTSNGIAEFKSNVGFSTATLNPTVQLQYGSTWNNGRLQILNGPTTMWEFGPSAVTSNVPITIASGNFNVSSGITTLYSGAANTRSLRLSEDGTRTMDFTLTSSNTADITANVPVRIANTTTAATSSITGAFQVGAGTANTSVGIGGGNVYIGGTTASTSTASGSLVVSGGVGVAGAINAGGAVTTTGLTVNGASSLAGDVTNVDSISFDLTAAEATGIGKLYWDAGVGELRYGLGGGNVEVAIGQTQVTYVRNAETSTITKGQVVYLFGAQGDRPSVKLASNTADTTSNKTFGIAAENIAANSDGYVINTGILSGVDTSAYTPGDILWLGSAAGTYTTTKAVAPNHLVFIGVVVKANQGGGQIYVKPQNGYELDEIHDVLISGIGLNHSLFYDSSVNVWKNYAPSAARTNLGLGTIATQNANSVAITGGAIDGTPIGATTPNTGKFTTLQTTGDATISGNLTVSGTTTTVNAQNLNITDNLFYLNAGSTNSNPDLGFAANYNDGTYAHAGFFRDATDGYWKVFKNYTPEPDASIYIDTSHASFALADIQAANFRGALVGNATTATTLAGTPTINGVTFNGGSNITITASTTNALTIGDGLSGTSFNGSSAVTIAADSTIARRADVHYIGTTSIALNRTSAAQTLTGINGLTAVGTNQSITLTPTGTGGVGIGTSSPNELLSIGYIDGSYGRIEFRSASYARQAIIEGVDDASSGNGHLAIYTRNSGSVFERLRVASNGNIGVGTTNPTTKFHISGGSLLVDAFNVGDETGIFFRDGFASQGNYNCSILVKDHNGSSPDGISINGYDGVSICTGADTRNERMRVAQNGNVGIGTTSPSELLDIAASANNSSVAGPKINFKKGSTNKAVIGVGGNYLGQATNTDDLIFRNDAGNILFGFSGAEKMRITSSGDIGIGTTSPGQIVEASRSQDADTAIKVTNTNAGASATAQFFASNGTNQTQFYHTGTAYGGVGAITANQGGIYTTSAAGLAIVANNAAGLIKFVTGGTGERVRIDASGNVGIGVSPTTLLHLRGSSPVIAVDDSGNGTAALSFRSAGSSYAERAALSLNTTTAELRLSAGVTSNTYFQTFHTNGSERMRIDSSGSILIAATSNSTTGMGAQTPVLYANGYSNLGGLRINGNDASNTIYKAQSQNLSIIVGDSYALTLGTNGAERARIDSSGNFAIGTTSSLGKFDVVLGTDVAAYFRREDNTNQNIRIYQNAGGGFVMQGGTVAKPFSIGNLTTGDTNFYTNNSIRATITGSDGYFGINTQNPQRTLDVNGNIRISGTSGALDFINTNTQIWTSGAGGDNLKIKVNGSDAITIDGNRNVSVNTTAILGNSTLIAATGVTAHTTTAGVSPYLQTYNGNATTNEKTWRIGGQSNGKFQIETVNDAYSSASTKVIITQAGNVGIGVDPTQALHVSGSARITGAIYDSSNSAGTNGQVLTSTGTGTAWSSSGVAVSGSGTAGKIAKWSATTALADSVITESSGNIGIDTTPTQKLDVNGNIGWNTDYVLSSSTITTTSTTANQVITSVSTTVYRTFKFIVQATDATAGKYQSQEILAVHNGSTVAHTEYTAINVGGAVATYDVDISGSTVRLLCTPLSANSTVFKVSMQLIKV